MTSFLSHCWLPLWRQVDELSFFGNNWEFTTWNSNHCNCKRQCLSKCIQFSLWWDEKNILLQPLRWCCIDCVIHHEQNVREEQKYICVARASNSKRVCDVEALPMLTCGRFNMMTSVREERLRHMISIVACCRGVKLCAHAAQDFRSQQYQVKLLTYAKCLTYFSCFWEQRIKVAINLFVTLTLNCKPFTSTLNANPKLKSVCFFVNIKIIAKKTQPLSFVTSWITLRKISLSKSNKYPDPVLIQFFSTIIIQIQSWPKKSEVPYRISRPDPVHAHLGCARWILGCTKICVACTTTKGFTRVHHKLVTLNIYFLQKL